MGQDLEGVIATILRSYSWEPSERFAYWLQERLATPRYGRVLIDPNEGLDSQHPWYEKFRALVAQGQYMIALLSPDLNHIDESDHYPGIALSSEILYFWSQQQEDPAFPSHLLIPICLDCSPADLARPKGEYEQLQDIVVPFIATLNPLCVSTDSFYGDIPETFKLSDAVALRMGIQPLIQPAQQSVVGQGGRNESIQDGEVNTQTLARFDRQAPNHADRADGAANNAVPALNRNSVEAGPTGGSDGGS